jgi:uncharacterized protein YjbI with pentapeptide repeats
MTETKTHQARMADKRDGHGETMTIDRRRRIDQGEIVAIAQRHQRFRACKPGGARAVLEFADASGLDFSSLDLEDAVFTGCRLEGANFAEAKLDHAIFFCADLRRADLRGASLRRADLRGTSLQGANLSHADMFECDFREGTIAEKVGGGELAFLSHEANGADLEETMFVSANLDRARMNGISAIRADFTNAVMRECKLVRAKLTHARMVGANLENADLAGADLIGANLDGAVLTGACLEMIVTQDTSMKDILTDAVAGRALDELERPVQDMLAEHVQFVASNGAQGAVADFSGTDLRPLGSLTDLDLTGLQAPHANMYGMDLKRVRLQGANLEGVDLRFALLVGADLRGINLRNAKLSGADLRDSKLGPLLLGVDRRLPSRLGGATLDYADLRGTDLRYADLTNAQLSNSRTSGAAFEGAVMEGTRLDGRIGGVGEPLVQAEPARARRQPEKTALRK